MPSMSQPHCSSQPSLPPHPIPERRCALVFLCVSCAHPVLPEYTFFNLHSVQFFHVPKQKTPCLEGVLLSSRHLIIYPSTLTSSPAAALDTKLFGECWGGGSFLFFKPAASRPTDTQSSLKLLTINKQRNQWPGLPRAQVTHFPLTFETFFSPISSCKVVLSNRMLKMHSGKQKGKTNGEKWVPRIGDDQELVRN